MKYAGAWASAFLGSRSGWFQLPQDKGVSQQVSGGVGYTGGLTGQAGLGGGGFSGRRKTTQRPVSEDCYQLVGQDSCYHQLAP